MTFFIQRKVNVFLCMASLVFSANTVAEEAAGPGEVRITKDISYVDVMHEGRVVRIERIQDEENVLTGGFAKTSRKCPPFCVNAIETAPGVKTVGELEILQFLQTHVKNNTGLLIDARTTEWYEKGTIPGSVNIPFFVFGKDQSDVELQEVLTRLGVAPYKAEPKKESLWDSLMGKKSDDTPPPKYDFSNAKELLLWCNGLWCGQSPRAIRNLLDLGYPPEKLHWYRGGMQAWRILGLTVVVPGAEL